MPRSFFVDEKELAPQRGRKSRMNQSIPKDCSSCTLSAKCISPKMEPHGGNRLNIAIIGEAPGKYEDEQDNQFVGKSGKFLYQRLKRQGIDLHTDCIKQNIVQCRPPNNRTPTAQEIQCCRPRLERQLQEIKPELIFAFGTPAIAAILNDAPFSPTATNMHGRVVPSVRYNCWVCCCTHPSWFLREDHKHDRRLDEAIAAGLAKLAEGPYRDLRLNESGYEIVENIHWIPELLEEFGGEEYLVAFDYETSCLSPFDKDAKLLTANLSVQSHHGHCIPLHHPHARWSADELGMVESCLRRWLMSRSRKVIQNWQFEELWSLVKLGTPINNVVCDTMVRQHVIDNRYGICKQEFQEYVRYGSTHKQDVNPVTLESEFLDTVARYGTLDVRYLLKIYNDQNEEMDDDLERAYRLFHEAIPVFARMKLRGIKVDKKVLDDLSSEVDKELSELDIPQDADCMKEFRKKYDKKWKFSSNQAQKRMFYGILGMTPLKLTEKGKDLDNPEHCSTDDESLRYLITQVRKGSIGHRMIKACTEQAGLVKLNGYIKGYRKLVDDDCVLHPSYLLHVATSYRSSSKGPNFQNIPIRKPRLARLRKCLVPRNDWLMEIDFSGAEIRAYAAITGDPVLTKHIKEGRDYHRHYAAMLYEKPEDEITNEERYKAKNGMIFPLLYGSGYRQIAEINPQWTEARVKKVEGIIKSDLEVLWKWKKKTDNFYHKHGYVQYPTGFRARIGKQGFLDSKQTANMPNQGSAFHRLLRVLLDIEKEIQERGLRSCIIGQIHDSIIADVFNDEIDELLDLADVMVTSPCWDWDAVIPWDAQYKLGRNLLELEAI